MPDTAADRERASSPPQIGELRVRGAAEEAGDEADAGGVVSM